ncbi:prolyl oligopeptidase family serine peptidase [Kocuria sp.]|uniref:prolyl oligopeptidase family serine peptidase n=1 Tax=Kocuria sp. TaxID=1871328 RepID=UPI0026DEE018|nr:prolyl oligopeptidase family serine peptidase [Kocuria sp.]MDO5619026.1 prolyl oligopeptidase family serine peptidase [Kocuria sp.]
MSHHPHDHHTPHAAALRGVVRRRFLGGMGAAAAVALVGCGADDSADEAAASVSPTEQPTPQPTVAPTEAPLPISAETTYEVAEPVTLAYGQASDRQYGELTVPLGLPENIKVPVLMVLHGGSWQATSTLHYMRAMARNMASYGIATWNVEYRGIGGGGGWPNTFVDVAAAMDFVPKLAEHIGRRIDRQRFFLTGHSAGGHLATWAASRHMRGSEQPGGRPVIRPAACVSYAGVYDLTFAQRSGHRHMVNLMGGTPSQVPQNYTLASPIHNIPQDVRFVCCHGTADSVVPINQTYNYAAVGEQDGNPAETVILLDTEHSAWADSKTYAYAVGQQRLLETITAVDVSA